MRVLVTGGAGFIGSHVLDRLVERGEQVICLDSFDEFYSPEVKRGNIEAAMASGLVRLVEGDVRDAELCRSMCDEGDVRAVIHLAARAGVRPSIEQPALYADVNVTGTANMLEAARLAGTVEKFVFGSSSSVYGVNAKLPFSEDDPVERPISPYAASKRAAELLCHVHHSLYGLPMVCLRFFTVYGPRQRPDLAIHKFTRLISRGEPIPVYGDGTSRRDYTYCSDVVNGIMAALDRPLEFETINLGNSEPVELRELIGLIEEALGKKATVERLAEQPGDVPVTYADISKARRLLGYAPRFPIGQGIAEFVEWFRRMQP
ncbi:MAG: NAD-dependent epimerase/dehydratase family protein [Planctomycetota bacterium]|jgi:UDP-glucuronate 4-epimerase